MTARDALGSQERGDAVGLPDEIAVRHRAPAPDVGHRGPLRVRLRRSIDHVSERHPRSPDAPAAYRVAAKPAASPVARHVPITRADPSASCVALMHRPAT